MDRADPQGTYRGDWDADGNARLTWVPPDGRPPQRVEHVVVHSPDGLAWGYTGSGPADTALSILIHATGDREIAEPIHQQFKREHIARLAINEPFALAGTDVAVWLQTRGIEPAIGEARPPPGAIPSEPLNDLRG